MVALAASAFGLGACGSAANEGMTETQGSDQSISESQILLSCSLLGQDKSSTFQISIASISEPSLDQGSSLIWTAQSEAIGDIPLGLSRIDQVIYGGEPDNAYLTFKSSDLRLYESRVQENLVAGKWYQDTISCVYKDMR